MLANQAAKKIERALYCRNMTLPLLGYVCAGILALAIDPQVAGQIERAASAKKRARSLSGRALEVWERMPERQLRYPSKRIMLQVRNLRRTCEGRMRCIAPEMDEIARCRLRIERRQRLWCSITNDDGGASGDANHGSYGASNGGAKDERSLRLAPPELR